MIPIWEVFACSVLCLVAGFFCGWLGRVGPTGATGRTGPPGPSGKTGTCPRACRDD